MYTHCICNGWSTRSVGRASTLHTYTQYYSRLYSAMCNIQLTCRCWAETVCDTVGWAPVRYSANSNFNIGVWGLVVKNNWRHGSLEGEHGKKRRQTMKEEKAHVQKAKQSTIEGRRTMLCCMCQSERYSCQCVSNHRQLHTSWRHCGGSQSMGGVGGHKRTNMHVLYTDSTHIQRQTKYCKSGIVPILLPLVFAF